VRGSGQILLRDLRELTGTGAFRIVAALLALLMLALAAGAALIVSAPPPTGSASGAPTATALVGAMLYFATFLPFLILIWAFAGPLLIKEKASGRLETLLATPLSPRALWLAKTATLALPALAVSALSSASLCIAAATAARALPAGTALALPPLTILVCLLGNPLLLSGLGALTVIIAFRASPDAAIIPSFALGFGLMAIVPPGMALGFIDLSSPAFASAYLAAGALVWALVLVLERGMSKERIVLSSRED
jgi:ABC-type Na+ efflux pump permease subunit